MGVPKFFRFISERYPCLSELARDQGILQFDNLYLDMNGIIHNCSHPDDGNIHFNITEEQMFIDICSYIDKLFFLIKPQKLFFMAVDGVAPRAKMNQQRGRRFRSAKEAELLEAKAAEKGMFREHERFDSNCITPGTPFMVRLQAALRWFVKGKISKDPLWQKCKIILSGHECPGEGEHKIMDYIRYMKTQPDYDPHMQHCIYGLDADLILLGLCTHELHFVVLREEVKFGRNKKRASLEETRFYLLHLSLLREYLELEFAALREHDPNFNIGQLIDDWVLMGFLVGNDFVPHLPFFHMLTESLPLLYKTYIKVYPSLGGNINVNGKLHLERLEKFFIALSEVESEQLQDKLMDTRYFEAKFSEKTLEEQWDMDIATIGKSDVNVANEFNLDVNEMIGNGEESEVMALAAMNLKMLDIDDSDELYDDVEHHKQNYYESRLNKPNMSSEDKRDQAIGYITALQWILDYYYRGVQSWDWYYPQHYAPFVSDLRNFKDHQFNFKLGTPFRPFEQLLAVLPAASKQLLPPAYQELMTSEKSALIDYYPKDFKTDLNGKAHEWEAVVLLPFIDEQLLLQAMRKCETNLTDEEVKRNCHGPMYQYAYCDEMHREFVRDDSRIVHDLYCTEKPIWSHEIAIPNDKTVCVEVPEVTADDTLHAGRPSMKHLKYNFELRHARVQVFDYASRDVSIILMPEQRNELNDIEHVAATYLNQIVYIGWPYLIKSKVMAVSNQNQIINNDGTKDLKPKDHQLQVEAAQQHLMKRMGIEFDDFSVLIHVNTSAGTTYAFKVDQNRGEVITEQLWNNILTAYPAQGIVMPVKEHSCHADKRELNDFFPIDSKIFFVGNPYFGSEGVVLDPTLFFKYKRIQVDITVLPEPDLSIAKRHEHELFGINTYVNAVQAARLIGNPNINVRVISRITGSLLIFCNPEQLTERSTRSVNIGLQLKFPTKQEERAGYARRIRSDWLFSQATIELLTDYVAKFPALFVQLASAVYRQEIYERDLLCNMDEVTAWLNSQPHTKADCIPCGSQKMNRTAMEEVLKSITISKTLPVKTVKLQVKPHLLLKPDVNRPNINEPTRVFRLFDRIVVVKTTYMVPIGSRGTVVGVFPIIDTNPVRIECIKATTQFLEVLFDKALPSAKCASNLANLDDGRIQKVPESCVLRISTDEFVSDDNKPMAPQIWRNNKQTNNNSNNNNNIDNNHNDNSKTSTNSSNSMHTANSTFSAETPTTSLQAQLQQQQQKPPSTIDDFWLPKPDTKVKHEYKQQQQQQEHSTPSAQTQKQSRTSQQQQRQQQQHRTRSDSAQQNAPVWQDANLNSNNNSNWRSNSNNNSNGRNNSNNNSNGRSNNNSNGRSNSNNNSNGNGRSNSNNNSNGNGRSNSNNAITILQQSNATPSLLRTLLGVKGDTLTTQAVAPTTAALPPPLPTPPANVVVANNSNDCQAETMMLRNLLGIATKTLPIMPTPTATPTAQPIKVQLPQPPLGWRSDAQNEKNNSSNNNNNYAIKMQQQQQTPMYVQQTQQQHHQQSPMYVQQAQQQHHQQSPMYVQQGQQQHQQQQQIPMPILSAFRPAVQSLTFTNNNSHSNNQLPVFCPTAPPTYVPPPPTVYQTQGQQQQHQQHEQQQQQQPQQQQQHQLLHLFNAGSLNQQGAFIPLQALRQQQQQQIQHQPTHSSSTQQQQVTNNTHTHNETRSQVSNTEEMLNYLWTSAAAKAAAQQQNAPQTHGANANDNANTKQQNAAMQQTAPRQSKIAAKFDNKH